ncbi:MAG: hypothetical protein GY855_12135 [candidate division Zixibacteria bacterium]|nr:hypothetical protein [candidate division Zixibacteria bacterium]
MNDIYVYLKVLFSLLFTVIVLLFTVSPVSAQNYKYSKGKSTHGKLKTVNIRNIQPTTGDVNVEYIPRGYAVDIQTLQKVKNEPMKSRSDNIRAIIDQATENDTPPDWLPDITSLTDFSGIEMTGFFPPDPVLAVGPNHVVVMVNKSWAIYNKTGTQLYETTLREWFYDVHPDPGPIDPNPFDPKVVYDHYAERWILLALESTMGGVPSYYMISVSQSSDPTGDWWSWALDANVNGYEDSTEFWPDWPGLGYDSLDAVYITSNQYDATVFQYAKLRILYKSQLYDGDDLDWGDFWDIENEDETAVFGLKPAHTFGSANVEYLLNTHTVAGNYASLWTLYDPTGSPPLLTLISTTYIDSFYAPPDAVQLNGNPRIDTGDCRIQDLQYRDGYLYGVFTQKYNWQSGNVSAIRYLKIDTSEGEAVDDLVFGADNYFYYYPAVYTDRFGRVVMVCNRSNYLEYVGVRYLINFPDNQTSNLLKAGEGHYDNISTGRNRWGDYSGIGLDPSDGMSIWFYGEYAETDNEWGTWIGGITPTELCGEVYDDGGGGPLSPDSGIYLVTCDVVVPDNETLTIEEGTIIIFSTDTKIGTEQDGLLESTGTMDNPINLLSEDYSIRAKLKAGFTLKNGGECKIP